MRKILGALASLIAIAGVALVAAPAYAYYRQADCTTANVSGDLTAVPIDAGHIDVTGGITDGQGRTWSWTMYHNGDVSAHDLRTGGGNINRSMVNGPGTDVIRFTFQNVSGPASCTATINYTV